MSEGTSVARDRPVLKVVDGRLVSKEVAHYADRSIQEGETILGEEGKELAPDRLILLSGAGPV